MKIPAHIQSSLNYYGLSIIERENQLFSLVDLDTGEWYEKMTIYYIQKLLSCWNQQRRDTMNSNSLHFINNYGRIGDAR